MELPIQEYLQKRYNAEFEVVARNELHPVVNHSKKNKSGLNSKSSKKSVKGENGVNYAETPPYADIGTWLEHQRHFLTLPFENSKENQEYIGKALKILFEGEAFGRNLRRVEKGLYGCIVNSANKLEYGDNADSVIKRKGFNKFGVDSGALLKALKIRLVK
jgi:hypothetical protein